MATDVFLFAPARHRSVITEIKWRMRRLPGFVYAVLLAVSVICLGFLLFLKVDDPSYNRGEAIFDNQTVSLSFEVLGVQKFEVRAPVHPLSPSELQDYRHFVQTRGYPVFAADGPLAVDP